MMTTVPVNTTPEAVYTTGLGRLYQGDCLGILPHLPSSSVDCVFLDPPFNLGKTYGPGVTDIVTSDRYLAWCADWLAEVVRTLAPGGAVFSYNLPRWNIEIWCLLAAYGLTFRHWIAIDLKVSLPIAGRLYPSHYRLLYYTRGKPRVFARPRVPIPTCRHCGGDIKDYGGHRNKLHPDGLNLTDVWLDIPPVRHRSTKTRVANELSPRLIQRVLEIATVPGDLVLDPFGGSGVTAVVAEAMGRRWIGVELGDCTPIIRRLDGHPPDAPRPNLGDAAKGLAR